MEVSSHSIDQDRIEGIEFAGAVFTNITHDHLDYHGTINNYISVKKRFFDSLPPGAFALVNSDDRRAGVMVQNTKASVIHYGLKKGDDFKARIIERTMEATLLDVNGNQVWVPFIGDFNMYNILAGYSMAVMLGLDSDDVLKELSNIKPAPGRFETIRSEDGKLAIVDYAHTPDALLNVLKAINRIKQKNSKLITLAGAGGDRDKAKRPLMGKIGAENSDRFIVTSDNPRSEDPASIIAIKAAVMMAGTGDIILIAGKGHETYQEIMGIKYHFDDRKEVIAVFNKTKTQT